MKISQERFSEHFSSQIPKSPQVHQNAPGPQKPQMPGVLGEPEEPRATGSPFQKAPLQPRRRLHPHNPDMTAHADGTIPANSEARNPTSNEAAEEPETEFFSEENPSFQTMHKNQATETHYPADKKDFSGKVFSSLNPSSIGPYQAVVVFLLLLMVLVIIGVVYQLFFRAENLPDSLQNSQSGNVISKSDEDSIPGQEILQTPKILKANEASGQVFLPGPVEAPPTSTEQVEKKTAPKQENTAPTEIPRVVVPQKTTQRVGIQNTQNISRSSPLSSITPGGEEISSPPPSAPALTTPSTPSDSNANLLQSKVGGIGYWIQVGAFSSLNNANSLKAELNQNRLKPVIQESKNERKKLYRVRMGLYTSKIEAERILRQLQNIGDSFSQSIIIRTEI